LRPYQEIVYQPHPFNLAYKPVISLRDIEYYGYNGNSNDIQGRAEEALKSAIEEYLAKSKRGIPEVNKMPKKW